MFEQQLTFPNLFPEILLSTIVGEDMEERNIDLYRIRNCRHFFLFFFFLMIWTAVY